MDISDKNQPRDDGTDAPAPLFADTVSVNWPADQLELGPLREGFAVLFDRAAHAVQLAGYEQDDALIDRSLICEVVGLGQIPVPSVPLGDLGRLRHLVDESIQRASGRVVPVTEVRVVALAVEARLDPGPNHPVHPKPPTNVP